MPLNTVMCMGHEQRPKQTAVLPHAGILLLLLLMLLWHCYVLLLVPWGAVRLR